MAWAKASAAHFTPYYHQLGLKKHLTHPNEEWKSAQTKKQLTYAEKQYLHTITFGTDFEASGQPQ